VNAESASRAEPKRILVWDAPVRVFHWLLVLCFAGAWLTAESERWRLAHVTLGYTVAGLVVFRIAWGLFGTRHARFGAFVRGPREVLRYLASLLRGRPRHYAGHNPAGALAIVALLALALGTALTGWVAFEELSDAAEDVHEALAEGMLALVLVHVAAVVVSSWLHRENLVASMVTGRKRGIPAEGIRHAWRGVAAIVLAATLGFWWLQWDRAPSTAGERAALSHAHDDN
jgi:cytochrome b